MTRAERVIDADRRVEFVDDADPDGRDEELPGRASGGLRRRVLVLVRRRVIVLAGVAALAVALLVALAVRHGRSADGPRPSPSIGSGRSVTLDPASGREIVALPLRTGPDPTRCPGHQCYTTPSVPAAVRTAVRAAFPAARFAATETIRLADRTHGDPLWYREVVARVGAATLTLRVQAHAAGDLPNGNAVDNGSRSVSYLDARLQQWFVRIQVVDRSGTADVLDRLGALAADTRLIGT